MYDHVSKTKRNRTKIGLPDKEHQLFERTAQANGLKKAEYGSQAIVRQMEIDNNKDLKAKASQMNITVQQLTDLILSQFTVTDDTPTANALEGAKNDKRETLSTS